MGGNTVSGAGGSKDPKKVAEGLMSNSEDAKLMQLQTQKESLNKEIKEQLSKKDTTNVDNKAPSKFESIEQKLEKEKQRLEQQVALHEQMKQADEDAKSSGFAGLAKRKAELDEQRQALEAKMLENYQKMTPEEKEKYNQAVREMYAQKMQETKREELEIQEKALADEMDAVSGGVSNQTPSYVSQQGKNGFAAFAERKAELSLQKAKLEKEIIENYKKMTPEQRDASQILYELELQHNIIEQELISVRIQENKIKAQEDVKNYVPKFMK